MDLGLPLCCVSFSFLFFFSPHPVAFWGRDHIWATVVAYSRSFNPLGQARDQTCTLVLLHSGNSMSVVGEGASADGRENREHHPFSQPWVKKGQKMLGCSFWIVPKTESWCSPQHTARLWYVIVCGLQYHESLQDTWWFPWEWRRVKWG